MDRIIESLSMTLAVMGRCSQICMLPEVLMGLNWPPVGAPGLRSQMSIVEGPPSIQSMMADFLFFLISAACVRMLWTSDRAGSAATDAPVKWLMKWRRDMPWGMVRFMACEQRSEVRGQKSELVLQNEFVGVKDGPEDVLESGGDKMDRRFVGF